MATLNTNSSIDDLISFFSNYGESVASNTKNANLAVTDALEIAVGFFNNAYSNINPSTGIWTPTGYTELLPSSSYFDNNGLPQTFLGGQLTIKGNGFTPDSVNHANLSAADTTYTVTEIGVRLFNSSYAGSPSPTDTDGDGLPDDTLSLFTMKCNFAVVNDNLVASSLSSITLQNENGLKATASGTLNFTPITQTISASALTWTLSYDTDPSPAQNLTTVNFISSLSLKFDTKGNLTTSSGILSSLSFDDHDGHAFSVSGLNLHLTNVLVDTLNFPGLLALATNGTSDTVNSSVTYTLESGFENLILTGSADINGTGNSKANLIFGNSGDNILDGGDLADNLKGGDGDDTYIVDLSPANLLQDTISENLNQGTDTVKLRGGHSELPTTVTLTLGANLENLDASATDTTKLNLTGNALDNTLTGNSFANILDGGVGADTMLGGLGNDTYVVDNTGDTVTELADQGTDTIRVTIATAGGTYTLGNNFENGILGNAVAYNLSGNELDNTLTGNAANNRLDGGLGADSMNGGAGNDTYVINNAGDIVTDLAGNDTVESSLTYSLGATLENLTLTGSASINGTGNALANILTGNSGVNILSGGTGNDTYFVGSGDSVLEAANDGIDLVYSSVDFSLSNNIENLVLTGVGDIYAYGNGLANVLTGNAGSNVFDGLGGADTLKGGAGDDYYYVDLTSANRLEDIVIENAGQGTDWIELASGNAQLGPLSITLGANLENLLAGGNYANPDAKLNLIGNALDNYLQGNDAANIINGGLGEDYLEGGLGDDTYLVDNSNDYVKELAGQGRDTVLVAMGGTYYMDDEIEIGTLVNPLAVGLIGNNSDNTLTGNANGNLLNGSGGADTMIGGLGHDAYVVGDSGDKIIDTAGIDTVYSYITYSLDATLENLILLGTTALNGTGNGLANILDSEAECASVLTGLGGNDTYIIGAGDSVVETANGGTDRVESKLSYTLGNNLENLTLTGSAAINGTGNGLANTIVGNSGNNTLDGGDQLDTLKGGAGNDTYIVDLTNANLLQDLVTENLNQGTDTVKLRGGFSDLPTTATLTLGANLENLDASTTGTTKLNLTGNAQANILTGNDFGNILNGGLGADTLTGGDGSDTYVVDNTGDNVTELLDGGTADTVKVGIATANGTYIVTNDVENATLTSTVAYNLTGNSLANTLTGNAAANILDGGAGADTMIGGAGNDTYIVDDAGDNITDTLGTDTVKASVDYSLGANLENLTLTGSTDINGTGNSLSNTLTGNAGTNILAGGTGNDTLWGGAGDDTFYFGSALNASANVDKIMDFTTGDTIALAQSIFGALSGGLTDANLKTGATASDANDYLIYNASTGALYYDADGSGAAAAKLFAYVNLGGSSASHPSSLAVSDFSVVNDLAG